MITLKQWMELVDYQITEGSDYHLNGETLFALTSWNGRQADGGYSVQIVFDPKTQVVYHVEACDYQRNRAYRLTIQTTQALNMTKRPGMILNGQILKSTMIL